MKILLVLSLLSLCAFYSCVAQSAPEITHLTFNYTMTKDTKGEEVVLKLPVDNEKFWDQTHSPYVLFSTNLQLHFGHEGGKANFTYYGILYFGNDSERKWEDKHAGVSGAGTNASTLSSLDCKEIEENESNLRSNFSVSIFFLPSETDDTTYIDGEVVVARYGAELSNHTKRTERTDIFQSAERYYYIDTPTETNNVIRIYELTATVNSNGNFEKIAIGECDKETAYVNDSLPTTPFDISMEQTFWSDTRVYFKLSPHFPWKSGEFDITATVRDTGKVKKNKTVTIVLSVLGSLFLLAIVVAVGFVLWKRSKGSSYKPLLA